MGIRVRKVMGYGLTDVRHDEGRINDPRISRTSRFLADYHTLKVDEYVAWLRERHERRKKGDLYLNMDSFVKEIAEEASWLKPSMYDTFAYDGEYGLPNVLCLTPLAMKDWRRYDDPIDYAVETYLSDPTDPQVNHVEVFEYGLFPWSESWMDARTGERIKSEHLRLWSLAKWKVKVSGAPRGGEDDKMRNVLAKAMGFDGLAHAEENIVPYVPDEVRDLAEYGGLFTDPSVCFQLRPLLYTYWS